MKKSFEKKYHSFEEGHWWFRARRDMIKFLLAGMKRDARILEIGCSGGQLINELNLMGFGNITGIDISPDAVAICSNRNINNVFKMDGTVLAFTDAQFDIIIASDVLEHIENDESALKEWKRVLKKNGLIISFVPAHQFLWSEHDIVNEHKKRYSKKELVGLIDKTGLSLIRISYWNFLLFFPITIFRLLPQISHNKTAEIHGQLFALPVFLNYTLFLLLKLENKFLTRCNLPMGVSIFFIAIK